MTIDVNRWTVEQYRDAVRSGVSPGALAEAALAEVARLPSSVLIGTPLADLARADAEALAGADPSTHPLLGVPVIVKDNIDVAGVVTTAGCPGFGALATRDATVVERLRRAGALIVGKANLDQFATGLVGTRSPYGIAPNALRADLVPGGSSSGSAVAVARGAVPVALGTDTAGSGRVPAAFNGIVGFKPTLGSVSNAGIVPAVRRLDCPSVLARSIADAAAVSQVIAGPDARDAFSRNRPPARPLPWPPIVGIPSAWPADLAVDGEIQHWFGEAVMRLEKLGVRVVPVDFGPLFELGEMLYGSSVVAERTAAVGAAIAAGLDGLDPVVAAIVGAGAGFGAVDAYRTEYRLAELRTAAAQVWEEVDVLALPTTPRLATLAEVRADPVEVNRQLGRFTTFVNLADAAAVVVPMEPGIPAGLQLVAPAWRDDELLLLGDGYLGGELPRAAPSCTIVVVGAHLEGQALNHQLTSRGAWLRERTTTAASYRLYALPATHPPKPGLVRVGDGGASIGVEVWSIGTAEFGSFVRDVPSPLCIGTVELADGSRHPGFLCEPWALDGAEDITSFGNWRAYLAGRPS